MPSFTRPSSHGWTLETLEFLAFSLSKMSVQALASDAALMVDKVQTAGREIVQEVNYNFGNTPKSSLPPTLKQLLGG